MADDTIVLENEYGRVVISPFAGASLRSLQVVSGGDRHELLSGGEGPHDPRHVASGTGSFIMAPWPNRIRDGELYVNGEVAHTLPIDSGRHAMHGTVRKRVWSNLGFSESAAHLALKLLPPWPFPGFLEYEVRLEGPSLLQSFTATDSGGTDFPFGFGWHPWFRRDLGAGPVVAHIPGQDIVWELDDEMVSTGRQLTPEGPTDLRLPMTPEIGSLDHCFRVSPGSTSTLDWPDGPTLSITSSHNVSHLQVYTPENAICVEPQTCAVDAFRLEAEGHKGTGALMVTGGESASGWTRWSWG
ncbi:MAG: hypothetical protein IIC92_05670 [Chloroflexi bacterium]|nr:hypothetical protein [Chloroflexota bacterium]